CLHLSPRSSSPPSCPYTPLFRSARRTWGGDSMESGQVLVVGAGPAGLCVALALAARGMEVEVVERQRREALAMPAFDGREIALRSEEHTSELQSRENLVCRLLLE